MTTSYTAAVGDLVETSTAGLTLTLPPATGLVIGDRVGLLIYGAGVSVSVNSTLGGGIWADGVSAKPMSFTGYIYREFVFDGTSNWLVASHNMRVAGGQFTAALAVSGSTPDAVNVVLSQMGFVNSIAWGLASAWPQATWAGFAVVACQYTTTNIQLSINNSSAAQNATISWVAMGT